MTQPTLESPKLARNISLAGAIALVVGGVVGAGIYVMVADIGAKAGSALWLAMVVAMVMSLVGVIPTVQLAGALPRDGVGYFVSSRMLNTFLGAMVSYWVIIGAAASTCVVSITLAHYLQSPLNALLPLDLSLHLTGVIILFIFWAVLQVGVHLAMSLQIIMALQFITALLLYAFFGVMHVPMEISITPPLGMGDFFAAILLSYTLCMGFQVVAEMGEEIVDARRNIPRALIIGGALVCVIYITVGQVFISHFPDHPATPLDTTKTLTDTAVMFMPAGLVLYLSLGAITAGITSLNAAAIAISREIFAQSRDGLLPAWIGKVSARTHAPQNAVSVYFLFVTLLLLGHQSKDFYGMAAAIGILCMSAVLGVACLVLPRKYPDYYKAAYIVFPYWLLVFCTIFTVLVALFFCVVVLMEQPWVAVLYAAISLLAAIHYVARTRGWTETDWARTKSLLEE